ncbi:hypothetical protein M441DRAFT_455954 [Trichoderma asperellum CBS 433.97]|uniref:Protection of telomeres protein 1 n=1 Tax=Trichoderma asperellum (strain ATCC 204424 / CBS 433.97 / NBRC 101777) TaxID=1042311 RepID=A0A2T3ZAV8_TRIA4|nr:hypothetical protein M441DRAFT_455954 [Trichoderma asperellum CBS 433.97]PTB41948.1 hypothetical protein M441DRAFT_455954 [Trichoderma asperellum CBS 433.97]
MAPHPNKRQNSLPSSFISIQDLLNHKRGVGNLVNVIGIIRDFKPPISTRGSDSKCEISLYDRYTEDGSLDSLTLNVFRPANEMPNPGLGDVIVLFQAKLQSHSDTLSLVTHWTTDIYLYSSSQIPHPPEGALKALRPQPRKTTHNPGQPIHEYVSVLYHSIDKSCIPSEAEFQDIKAKSITVNEKFKELKDIRVDTFVDVIVQLVRQPYDTGDRITLWISDYTENDSFFHFAWKGPVLADRPADPYGYESVMPYGASSGGEWKGPFGKRSMQVTCFDPHTTFIREQGLSFGSWVMLRNLQIKYGRNGANLEGFLREDRGSSGLKINITQMDITDTESLDPRLKEAVRRKRDYQELKKDQMQQIFNASMAGKKRKSDLAEMETTPSDKPRRNRKKTKKKSMGHDESVTSSAVVSTVSSLTGSVKCEYENKPISTFEEILNPIYLKTKVNGQQVELQLPFVNLNYRADVRVVNFMPPDLRDFAKPKKISEYGMLSDHEESDANSDEDRESIADRAAVRQWEWRFFLELEDANAPKDHREKKKTLWVAVNNSSAQCLLDLDASDLHEDQENLDTLRHRLFFLWGELEDKKSIGEENKRHADQVALANRDSNRPPLHSSDDESIAPQKQDIELRSSQISNTPFSCCIRQYGVKVLEQDPAKADAGEGKRWQRMFGLFGTRITST